MKMKSPSPRAPGPPRFTMTVPGGRGGPTAISAANDATSSERACGSCPEIAALARALRFDRRKGHRSVREIRLTAFRRRPCDPAPDGGLAAICCWSVLRSAAAASAAAVASGEDGMDTGSSLVLPNRTYFRLRSALRLSRLRRWRTGGLRGRSRTCRRLFGRVRRSGLRRRVGQCLERSWPHVGLAHFPRRGFRILRSAAP